MSNRKLELPEEQLKINPIEPEKGDLVCDKITGFEGVIVCVLDYLHGCKRLAVKSTKLKDNMPIEEQYFDSHQVTIIDKGFYFREPEKVETKKPGGEQEYKDQEYLQPKVARVFSN